MDYPDKPDVAAGVTHWNFLIQVGGYVVGHIGKMRTDEIKQFKKILTPIKKWDAPHFYQLYQNIERKAMEIGIFVLPFWRYRHGVDHLYGFTVDDQ